MNSQDPQITTNHSTIKNWIKKRDGEPALVEGIVDIAKVGEMLRIHFLDDKRESLKSISWDLFFKILEENSLALSYHEKTSEGNLSKSYKFIKND